MSERLHRIGTEEKEKKQIIAAERIGERTLRIIDREHGSGYSLWLPGRDDKTFHNGHHGRTVGEDGEKMGIALGFSSADNALMRATGNSHDRIFSKGRGIDERESAYILARELKREGVFPRSKRLMAKLAIIGTEPVFDENGMLIGQKATEMEYPDEHTEKFAKGIACADLGRLYTREGPLAGWWLYEELGKPFETESLLTSLDNQITMLETYRYPLPEAEEVLATHRSEVMEYLHATRQKIENGDFESMEALKAHALEFMQAA